MSGQHPLGFGQWSARSCAAQRSTMPSQPPIGARLLSETPLYNWQRFWIPRTGTVDLSDGGFLADPTTLLLRSSATKPHSLTELTEYRVLVLLGEPGIGKSTTLKEEVERIAAQAVAEDT